LAVNQGFGVILSYPYYGEGIGTINAGMLVTRTTIEKNPKFVHQLVSTHAKATEYLQENAHEWLKRASAFGTPLEVLKKAQSNMELAWDMDQSFMRKTQALGQRMQALGVIENQPDYDQLFDLSFVRDLKKGR
jgi:NitT/TauT family transport system substrate-binding protein